MMQVTIHAAKSDLAELIDRAKAGEDVVISEDAVPLARLVPIEPRPFRIGILREVLGDSTPDFLERMPNEDLDIWKGRD